MTRGDVVELHQSLRETPIVANRVVALLSKMMNLAVQWGVRPDTLPNPCKGVRRCNMKQTRPSKCRERGTVDLRKPSCQLPTAGKRWDGARLYEHVRRPPVWGTEYAASLDRLRG